MSRTTTACPASPAPRRWHKAFLAMLPQIIQHAKFAFRHLKPEARAEAVQNVVTNSCAAVAALARRGKLDLCYPTVLAQFGIKQTRDHRITGGSLNIKDVLSKYCQANKNLRVERLDHYDPTEQEWTEVVVEDKTAGPADIARTRIDFSDWLASLKRRDRRVAEFLANGESTTAAARRFRVSAGRISQLRRELAENWKRFIGGEEGPAAMAV